MPNQPELRDIQAWLHTFVVEQGDQDSALRAAEEKAGFHEGSAEDLILPSPTLSPKERIQIYRGMYLLRMQEALEIDFPVVAWYVGEERFRTLVAEYVRSYPSQSYTLDHLGRHFADFLQKEEGQAVSELATLEWTLCEVAVAHDSECVSLADLAALAEGEFLNITLQPVHALSRLCLSHDVNRLFKAWSEEETPFTPSADSIRLVCWRHELKVWRRELSKSSYAFLCHLCEGTPLGESIDLTLASHETSEEQIFDWFQEWLAEGFFQSFTKPNETGE